jgi:hypothetical protein
VPVDVLDVIRSNLKQNHFAHGGVPCIRARALELEAGVLELVSREVISFHPGTQRASMLVSTHT